MDKPKFNSELVIQDIDGIKFRLYLDLVYYSALLDTIFIAPAGFVTDLCSIPSLVPNWVIPQRGKHNKAGVVHDWLYKNALVPRDLCDRIFLEALEVCGVDVVRRNLMYRAVRLRGGKYYQKIDLNIICPKL